MTRTSATCCLLLLTVAAFAAPAAKETPAERLARVFGKLPASDAKFEDADGKGMRVLLPASVGTYRSNAEMLPVDASARTALVLEGNFVVQVRVTAIVNRDARAGDREIGVAAGLYYLGEKDSCYGEVCVRHQTGRDGKRKTVWNSTQDCLIVFGKEIFMNQGEGLFTADPCWLRLSRSGTRIVAERSKDGKSWAKGNAGFEKLTSLPPKLTVGVFAAQNTGEKAEVLFDEFRFTPPPDGKP